MAAISELTFPIFAAGIAGSERGQRWLGRWRSGQRSVLGLSRTASLASSRRRVRGSCGSVGGEFSLGGLQTSCRKRGIVRRYWTPASFRYRRSPIQISFGTCWDQSCGIANSLAQPSLISMVPNPFRSWRLFTELLGVKSTTSREREDEGGSHATSVFTKCRACFG